MHFGYIFVMDQNPLHIVMLIDAWFPQGEKSPGVFGGGQVHVRELRERLSLDYGCTVELFYASHRNLVIRSLWALWVVLDVLLYNRYHDPVNLIHTHGVYSGFAGKLISFLLKIPVVHTIHSTANMDQAKKTPAAWMERLLLTKIKYSAQISVSSHFLEYPNVNTQISVIPNGVDVQAFNQVRVVKYPEPTLIWVGRNHPSKGLPILKQAIKKVRQTYPQLKAILVTGGSLSGRELITAYKKAALFCLPSLAESQPITLLEAWAAKLPVVVTRVGENAIMVKDGVNGYLVDPGNAQQLAGAIQKILKSPAKAASFGQAGYDLVKSTFAWDIVVSKTYALYRQILSAQAVVNQTTVHLSAHPNRS